MSDLYSYDTICLRPKYSSLKSRSEANTSVNFLGKTFKLPVIPANMRDVISYENAQFLSQNDYFYIMHRFEGETYKFLRRANIEQLKLISISVGTTDYKLVIDFAKNEKFRIDYITIDVAHAHHENIENAVKYIRSQYPDIKLIVGNVATFDAAIYLYSLSVDAIKVGIGGGSICTTRYQTGFHLPTLHSVYECERALIESFKDVPIIADGGLKHYGDIAKALTFGATMVMSGGWFASCIDSPAKVVHGKKIYRGSTSYEAKGENRHIEGRTLNLEEGLTYIDRIKEIQEALQSSISYAGGKDLSAFKSVDWETILPNH
jgi:GMP reductase